MAGINYFRSALLLNIARSVFGSVFGGPIPGQAFDMTPVDPTDLVYVTRGGGGGRGTGHYAKHGGARAHQAWKRRRASGHE